MQHNVHTEQNNWKPTLWCFRKNMQRNKQVAMGRKKFNMDPKKVGGSSCCDVNKYDLWCSHVTWDPVSSSGDPVPDWERLAEEHQRWHCSISLQGRGPQQNGHWRLPRREVWIKPDFAFLSLFLLLLISNLLHHCSPAPVHAVDKSIEWHTFLIAPLPLSQAHTHPLPNTVLLVPHLDRPVRTTSVAQQPPSVFDYLTHP